MQDTQKNSPEITRKRDRDYAPLVNHRDRTWYRMTKNDGIPKRISRVSCATLVHIETPKESLNVAGTRDGDFALLMNQQDWAWYSIRNKKQIPKRIFGIPFRLLVHPESTKKIFQDNKEMRRRWLPLLVHKQGWICYSTSKNERIFKLIFCAWIKTRVHTEYTKYNFQGD